jgi:hypothetical protein
MGQAQDIIQQAYRELNLIAIGKDPTAAQLAEGLSLLNQAYTYVVGGPAGEFMQNWPLGNYGLEDIYQFDWNELQITNPPINSRLVATAESALTVYFPVRPSDGSRMGIIDPYDRLATYNVTLDGNGSTIEETPTVTISTNGTNKEWIFRADLGDWKLLNTLIATDASPFPDEFDPYFSILLALRMSPRAGVALSDATMAAFQGLKNKFEARYIQRAPLKPDPSLDLMSYQSYQQWWAGPYASQAAFNNGWGTPWW